MKNLAARINVGRIVLMIVVTTLLISALTLWAKRILSVEPAGSWPFASAVPNGFHLKETLKFNDNAITHPAGWDVWVLQGDVRYSDANKSQGVTETILIVRETNPSTRNDESQSILIALRAAEAAAGLAFGSSHMKFETAPLVSIEGSHAGFAIFNVPPHGVRFSKKGDKSWIKEVWALGGVAAKQEALRLTVAGASIAGDSIPADRESRHRVEDSTIELRNNLRKEFSDRK